MVLPEENEAFAKLTPREFLRLADVESWRSRGVPDPAEWIFIKDTAVVGELAFPDDVEDEAPSLMTMDVNGTERVVAWRYRGCEYPVWSGRDGARRTGFSSPDSVNDSVDKDAEADEAANEP